MGLQLELLLELLLHKLLLLLLFLLRLSQLLLLLHLLGEGLLLEHLGRLALQFFHARLVRLIEDALVFLSLGLYFALSGLHPIVALLFHVALLLQQLETFGLQLEALLFQLFGRCLGRSHAVEHGWSHSLTGSMRSGHSHRGRTET